jgi:hypothetical protein
LSSLASKNNKRQFGTFSDAGASEPKSWLHQTEAAELSFFPPFARSVNAHRVSTPHLALSSLALCSRVPTLLSLSLISRLNPSCCHCCRVPNWAIDRKQRDCRTGRTFLTLFLSLSIRCSLFILAVTSLLRIVIAGLCVICCSQIYRLHVAHTFLDHRRHQE